LAAAAQVMSGQQGALQLRYLQTLTDISAENNSTIIFPFPIELLAPFMGNQSNRIHPQTGDTLDT
jgi:hypothetical protein